jgi:hypothetical protein
MPLPAVLAVVDASDMSLIVWWVYVGAPDGLNRMRGAWVLPRGETDDLAFLLGQPAHVMTAAGDGAVGKRAKLIPFHKLDPSATLSAVQAECEMLETARESHQSNRKGSPLVPLALPLLPKPLDVEDPPNQVSTGDGRRALAIARWFESLCDTWSEIERKRLGRSYLASVGGPTARALPVVLVGGGTL